MKILVVDDHAGRYRVLLEMLSKAGLGDDGIDIVSCTNDARDRLEEKQYDLMVLDILIPLRNGEEPNERAATDLLTEVTVSETLNRPRHIVGITSDSATADRVNPIFGEYLWTVIRYSPSNDSWAGQIRACVEYLAKNSAGPANHSYGQDVVILCALRDPELAAVLALDWKWSPPRPIDDVTFVHDGSMTSGGRTLSVSAAAAPRMGMIATALTAARLIETLKPRLLIMAGICAGVAGKVKLGDVILADPAWDWQSGKRTRDKENAKFSMAPHQLPAPAAVRAHVDQLRSDTAALTKIAAGFPAAPTIPKIVPGPMASGSAVLADGEVIKAIKDQHRELCAVEMEAYGLYASAHTASRPQPLAFALKSVCDYADPDKDDENQKFAAYASAQVVNLLLERYGARLADCAEG